MRFLSTLLCILCIPFFGLSQGLGLYKAFTYHTGQFNMGGAESHAFERISQRIFSTNAAENKLDILRVSDLSKAALVARIDLVPYGGSVKGVTANDNTIAVAFENNFAPSDGKVVFFDTNGVYINEVVIGANPKMIAFSPSLQHILVANEGRPSDDYFFDPQGTVSIINFSSGNAANVSQADVQTVRFLRYDTAAYDPLINIYGNNGSATFSEDVEPEHIAFNSSGTKAYVSLQENNALAIIDIFTAQLDTVIGLGYKDFNLAGQGIDASDLRQGIAIQNHFNVFGLYQPDGIAFYSHSSANYILSANEGAPREYTAYNEVEPINNVNLNPIRFNSPSTLQNDTILGRLEVTTTLGKGINPFVHDSLMAFGGRSFSIWDSSGTLVWDSGDDFEQSLAVLQNANFNSLATSNTSKKQSSSKRGPEPQAICIGAVNGATYAFIGLGQMGGIMVYDISTPTAPSFDSYILDRDFTAMASDSAAGDLRPEQLSFIPSNLSPSGFPLLIVSNSVSGTLTVYQVGSGLNLPELKDEILSAYPNPSSGLVHFSEEASFTLFDAQGRYLGQFKNQKELNLSSYPKGYYLLKSSTGGSLRLLKN